MGEIFLNNIFSKNTLQIHSQNNHAYSSEGSLPKLLNELWNFGFLQFFSLTWDLIGVKVSNDISSEKAHQICSTKFMYTPGEGLCQSC